MIKQEDGLEKRIKEDLYSEAKIIEEEVGTSGGENISEEIKEDIRLKLQKRIDDYEKEKAYAGLSAEDREALELGRKIKENQKAKRPLRGKKLLKMCAALAAALVMVLAIGITSMGGPEKFVSVIEQLVGKREVVQVDSDEKTMIMEDEDEHTAYQAAEDAFGVEPVRLANQEKGMKFIQMNLDEKLQVAEMIYEYNGINLVYIINAGYYDSSFGIDVEDEIVKKETIQTKKSDIELTVYRVENTDEERCSAHFTYQKLEYFLIGTVSEEEFKLILKNLYF